MNLDFDPLFWPISGAVLVLLELVVPGLVVVFLGFASFSVALCQLYGFLSDPIHAILAWIGFSTLYCFSLRLLAIKFYPRDTIFENINEDENVLNQIVEVVKEVGPETEGRISHSDSTWPAKSKTHKIFHVGDKVKIVGRDNLTWIVDDQN